MTSSISDQDLSDYNHQGLIPGPNESEDGFLLRADYCQHIRQYLTEKTGLPIGRDEFVEEPKREEMGTAARVLYGIFPNWVPIIYDNHKLSFWHGGCAWIFQSDEESPLSAVLQLRSSLSHRGSVYGFINKQEIIAHEICHVGRMAFEEPIFEEFFAYATSTSRFRRWLGPIVKNSIESGIFVLLLLMIFFIDLFFLFLGSEQALQQMMWLKAVPFALLIFGLFRLNKRHQQLKRCLSHLEELCDSPSAASSIAFRLTDQEIITFGKWSTEEIRDYIDQQKEISLRWRMIYSVYLKGNS
ncbi:MAG: hypothetical protein AAGG81_05715 [Chlamydiota bacterium]